MRRYSVRYKGDKYLGDSYEAIAFRIQKDHGLSFNEAFEIVKDNIGDNKETPINNNYTKQNKKKGLQDYADGALALVSIVKGQYVTQEEINRRSILCTQCPKLEQIPGCMGCGLAGRISKMVNNIKKHFGKGFDIPNGLETKGCGVCGCALSVMLPAKIDQFKMNDQNIRPDNCWVKKTSPNYIQ